MNARSPSPLMCLSAPLPFVFAFILLHSIRLLCIASDEIPTSVSMVIYAPKQIPITVCLAISGDKVLSATLDDSKGSYEGLSQTLSAYTIDKFSLTVSEKTDFARFTEAIAKLKGITVLHLNISRLEVLSQLKWEQLIPLKGLKTLSIHAEHNTESVFGRLSKIKSLGNIRSLKLFVNESNIDFISSYSFNKIRWAKSVSLEFETKELADSVKNLNSAKRVTERQFTFEPR